MKINHDGIPSVGIDEAFPMAVAFCDFQLLSLY